MARALIVGCGCRGRALGAELRAAGWQVRGTSRDPKTLEAIAAAGIEPADADPERLGTIVELVGDVAVVIWPFASATGDPEQAAGLHSSRLERFLELLIDTPVRGFVYEAAGTVAPSALERGIAIVRAASERHRIPTVVVDHPASDPSWAREMAGAAERLLKGP